MNRNFACIINYGIEYRNLLLSGLADELSKDSKVTILYRNGLFPDFREFFDEEVIMHYPYADVEGALKRSKLENYFHYVRKARMRSKGIGIYKNYNPNYNENKVFDFIIGNDVFYNIFRKVVTNEINDTYFHEPLKKLLKHHGITDIIISGYSSINSMAFGITALALGLNVHVLINSWKDIYINDFIPFQATSIFTWSENMKSQYKLLNPHIKADSIYTIGNPIFDRFYDFTPRNSREYYESKYKLLKGSPFILYTMLDPRRYPDELKVLDLIAKSLDKKNKNLKIVIRRNPFDSSSTVEDYFKDNPRVVVADHFSKRDDENDFFIQSLEGEIEWLDLLYFSEAVLGVASTVAVEALLLKKKVLNISFGKNGKTCERLKQMNLAPFFTELYNREDVTLVNDLSSLGDEVDGNQCNEKWHVPYVISPFDGNSTRKALMKLKSL